MVAAVKQQDDRSHSSCQPCAHASSLSLPLPTIHHPPLLILRSAQEKKRFLKKIWAPRACGALIRWEQTTSKGCRRQNCPARLACKHAGRYPACWKREWLSRSEALETSWRYEVLRSPSEIFLYFKIVTLGLLSLFCTIIIFNHKNHL